MLLIFHSKKVRVFSNKWHIIKNPSTRVFYYVLYFKDSSNAFWLSATGGRRFSSRRNPILILIYGNFQFFNELIITHFSKFFKG